MTLHFVYYNFVKQHKTFRITPAMAAALTKRFMSIEDIVRLIPEQVVAKRGNYKRKYDKKICILGTVKLILMRIFLLFILATAIISCSSRPDIPQYLIQKKWEVDPSKSTFKDDAYKKGDWLKISYDFLKDGSLLISTSSSKKDTTLHWKYMLDQDGKTLKILDHRGKTYKLELSFLNKTSLIIKDDENNTIAFNAE